VHFHKLQSKEKKTLLNPETFLDNLSLVHWRNI